MELKVWVEGIQRIICGVTENTTCQDIVYALAHATGQTGRFTLIERWRNNERLLAPHENPLKILSKWGEYSNDVQFVLQRTAVTNSESSPTKSNTSYSRDQSGGDTQHSPLGSSSSSDSSSRNIKKSLTISSGGGYRVAAVSRNIQQQRNISIESPSSQPPPPYREPPRPKSPGQQLPPPPYRAPPSPAATDGQTSNEIKKQDNQDLVTERNEEETELVSNITLNPQYKELIMLVNQQREKLGLLQADLTKYDAEIAFWESKTKEQQHKAEVITQEGNLLEETYRVVEEQMAALKNIEEEKEISKQQSKTLKSEITLLRSKLANCETELLQCKIKIRRLIEAIQIEETKEDTGSELIEQIEELQKELEEAKAASVRDMAAGSELDHEVDTLECLIKEKKLEMEQLVQDMKEANLHSLLISPATEDGLRTYLLEGMHKPRRMIGSPRQLENAVPTSKNPHGVWV